MITPKFQIKSFGKDILWTIAGQIIIMVVLLVINKVLSNSLSIEDFGVYNIIKRFSSVISFVMLAGLGISIPRYLPVYLHKDNLISVRDFMIAASIYMCLIILIVCLVVGLAFNDISRLFLNTDSHLLVVSMVYSLVLALSSFLFAYLRGMDKFKKFNISQIIFQLVFLIPLLFIGKLNISQVFILWSILGILIIFLFSTIEVLHSIRILKFPISLMGIYNQLKLIGKYSPSRLLGDFFLFAMSAFPLMYINKYGTLSEVSYFSVGITFVSMVLPLFSFLGIILLPHISKLLSENRIDESNILIRKLLYIYIVSSFIITIVLYVSLPLVIPMFFSSDFLNAIVYTRIMIISIIPESLYLLYRNPIDAISVFPYNTINLIISFILLVILFICSSTLEQFARSYLWVKLFEGLFSIGVWYYLKKNINEKRC